MAAGGGAYVVMSNIIDWRVDSLRMYATLAFPRIMTFGPPVGDLTVYDSVTTEVVSFAAHFDLNSIPSAELQVPLGREMKSGVIAQLHAWIEKMRVLVPIRVWLVAQTQAASPGTGTYNWPD